MRACFPPEVFRDRLERNHRFLEESLELVQACGGSAEDAHKLVDYVFSRPVGDKAQEIGGVMVTLAALCEANYHILDDAAEIELARVWEKIDAIRAKQATRPIRGPLPGEYAIEAGTTQINPVFWPFGESGGMGERPLDDPMFCSGD